MSISEVNLNLLKQASNQNFQQQWSFLIWFIQYMLLSSFKDVFSRIQWALSPLEKKIYIFNGDPTGLEQLLLNLSRFPLSVADDTSCSFLSQGAFAESLETPAGMGF